MKTLNEWQCQPDCFFDTLVEASQKLHRELRETQGFREIADLAMCINRILMELQHIGQVSDKTAWQCKYLCWKCEQCNESQWIHRSPTTEAKVAINAFLKLTEQVDKVSHEDILEDAKTLIKQSAVAMQRMSNKIWN